MKNKKILLFIVAILFLTACSEKNLKEGQVMNEKKEININVAKKIKVEGILEKKEAIKLAKEAYFKYLNIDTNKFDDEGLKIFANLIQDDDEYKNYSPREIIWQVSWVKDERRINSCDIDAKTGEILTLETDEKYEKSNYEKCENREESIKLAEKISDEYVEKYKINKDKINFTKNFVYPDLSKFYTSITYDYQYKDKTIELIVQVDEKKQKINSFYSFAKQKFDESKYKISKEEALKIFKRDFNKYFDSKIGDEIYASSFKSENIFIWRIISKESLYNDQEMQIDANTGEMLMVYDVWRSFDEKRKKIKVKDSYKIIKNYLNKIGEDFENIKIRKIKSYNPNLHWGFELKNENGKKAEIYVDFYNKRVCSYIPFK